MGFDNVCLQRRDLLGLVMHQCDIDSNAWFHRMLFEVDLWQEPNREKNGTSIGQCLDVFTPLGGCIHTQPAHMCIIISHKSEKISVICAMSNIVDSSALTHFLTVCICILICVHSFQLCLTVFHLSFFTMYIMHEEFHRRKRGVTERYFPL